MKLTTTLFAITFALSAFAQNFELQENPNTISSALKQSSSKCAIKDNQFLVHGSDMIEIIDLSTGDILYTWDPKGGYGESFISSDGKRVANKSQNYKDPELGYVDVYQVLEVETKKEYFRTNPDDLWTTTGISHNLNEVAIQTYNFDDHKARLIRFDFVNNEILSTLYTSEKSSTVILDIAYSNDDQYIFATIATNASVSSLYVYETESGKRVAKVPLVHQADKIFLTDEYVVVSGSHGMKATDHTTLISIKDYTIKKEWKGSRIDNLDHTGQYSMLYDWEKQSLSSFDIETGEKELILDGNTYKINSFTSAFSENGNLFVVAKQNSMEYYKTENSGKYDNFYLLNNKLIADPINSNETNTTNTTEEAVVETEPESEPAATNSSWVSYQYDSPSFETMLPVAEPKVKVSTTKKGNQSVSITGASKTQACVISTVEIPTIKTKKYQTLAVKMGEEFIKKKSPVSVIKADYSYEGQEGVEYTFKIDKFEYMYRAFCYDGQAYQLIYLAPTLDEKEYNNFFDTFKLK